MKSEQFWRNKVNISKSGNFLSHFYARIEHRLERGFQKSEDQAGHWFTPGREHPWQEKVE
jgi:hypothetical protein